MNALTIPVLVDDVKRTEDFPMTRVSFYYVETIDPIGTPVENPDLGIPLLPIGYSAVIFSPPEVGGVFESASQIEKLFERVEENESYYVDADSIFVPTILFDTPPERSAIFRIPIELFLELYRLNRGGGVPENMASRFHDRAQSVFYSEVETQAYRDWGSGILDDVIKAYPKTKDLKLSAE